MQIALHLAVTVIRVFSRMPSAKGDENRASAEIPFPLRLRPQIRPDLLAERYLCSSAPLFSKFILAHNKSNVKDFSQLVHFIYI